MKRKKIEEVSSLCHRCEEPRIHGLIEGMLLLHIGEKPRHGYELYKVLSSEFPKELIPDVAVIYRLLRNLEKGTYILSHLTSGEGGPARKVYALTSNGRDHLAQRYESIQLRIKALSLFLNSYERLVSQLRIEEEKE